MTLVAQDLTAALDAVEEVLSSARMQARLTAINAEHVADGWALAMPRVFMRDEPMTASTSETPLIQLIPGSMQVAEELACAGELAEYEVQMRVTLGMDDVAPACTTRMLSDGMRSYGSAIHLALRDDLQQGAATSTLQAAGVYDTRLLRVFGTEYDRAVDRSPSMIRANILISLRQHTAATGVDRP